MSPIKCELPLPPSRECAAGPPGRAGGSLRRHGGHVQREVRRGPESSGAHPRRLLGHLPVLPGVPLH